MEINEADRIPDQTRFEGGKRDVGVTLKDEVFTQRSLIRKLNFEQIQRRLFILKKLKYYYGSFFKNSQKFFDAPSTKRMCPFLEPEWVCDSFDHWSTAKVNTVWRLRQDH